MFKFLFSVYLLQGNGFQPSGHIIFIMDEYIWEV